MEHILFGWKIRFLCVFIFLMPKPRGRPKKSLLERLRVIYWSHQVLAASGRSTADGFEKLFRRTDGAIWIPRGSWSRYLRGEISPQGAKDKDATSLVRRFDKRYPGTAPVFHHPVWQLLDFQQFYSPEALVTMYMRLPAAVWHQFVSTKQEAGGNLLPDDIHFWRSSRRPQERIERLNGLTDLDGVAAGIIEARMEYLGQSKTVFLSCLEASLSRLHALGDDSGKQLRYKSCTMLMEAYCVGFVIQFCRPPLASVSGAGSIQDRQALKIWSAWTHRVQDHQSVLAPTFARQFHARAKEIISIAERND